MDFDLLVVLYMVSSEVHFLLVDFLKPRKLTISLESLSTENMARLLPFWDFICQQLSLASHMD